MTDRLRTTSELLKFVYGSPMQELADTDGRYLGEHIAERYDKSEDARLVFRDPRDQTGLVANVGALRQVRGAWPAVLHLLSPSVAAPTVLQMLDATRMPLALIARWWLDGRPIPPALAAAYKASVGYGQILRTWLLRGVPESPPDLHPFLAFVDAEGWLIGKDYVCPGSRRAVAEGWTVLCGDPASDFVEEPPSFAHEKEAAEPLRDALGSFEGLFFAHYAHLRASGALPEKSTQSVVLQLAEYVSGYVPKDAVRLSRDPRVAEFVSELDDAGDGTSDARALFARYSADLVAPFAERVAVSPTFFEELFGA